MINCQCFLLFENEINSQNQENKTYQVIEPEIFIFEEYNRECCKNKQRNYFLDNFQLD